MTRWVIVVTSADAGAELDGWLAAANAAAARDQRVSSSSAGRHLPGSVGPGQVTWDVTTTVEDLDDVPVLADLVNDQSVVCERVALHAVRSHRSDADRERVKRTLLLRVRPETPASTVVRFEQSLAAMPDHIDTIGSWALSRVDATRSSDRWTHVWEQEFADVTGLRGAYMHHPYHWTGVERWFDPEIPGSIVDADVAHLFRMASGPVVS